MQLRRRSLAIGTLVALGACVDFGALRGGDDAVAIGDGGAVATCDGAACAPPATSDGGAVADGGCAADQVPTDGGCLTVCSGKACAMHMVCGSGGSCECATGYTAADAGACVFTGGPVDPGFQNTPVAWAGGGRVVIDASAPGSVEPGVAKFPNACPDDAMVSQSFPMPALALAEPLALDTSSLAQIGGPAALTVSLGGRRFGIDLVGGGTYQRAFTCLGERAYGGTIDLALGHTCGNVTLDHAGFVSAPLCPLPGAIANGDFQAAVSTGSPGEWRPSDGASVGTCGAGTCGVLTAANACSNPRLNGGPISVPASMTKPALRFALNAPNAVAVDVALYGAGQTGGTLRRFVGRARGTNTPQLVTLCLPEWSRGLAVPLELGIVPTDLPGGTCDARGVTATIDDLQVVSEPSCEDPPNVFDPGFERGAGNFVYSYVPLDTTFASASVSTFGGHTGTSFARLSASGVPPRTRALVVPITIPAGGHAAFSYFYRAVLTGNVAASVAVGAAGAQAIDVATDTWSLAHVCLPSAAAGAASEVRFAVSSSEYSGQVQLDLDDFVVGSDPTCP